jgi:tetratricopeptide (TPR) repeat protein
MTDSSPEWHAEGRVSFTTFVTDLLRTDQSILDDGNFSFPDARAAQLMFWHLAQQGAKNGMDNIYLTTLPDGLSRDSLSRLFHERVHYAQLLSYPLLQLKFLHDLEELRVRVAHRGGRADVICGETDSDRTAQLPDVLQEKQFMNAIMEGDPQVEATDMVTIPGGGRDAGLVAARFAGPGGRRMPGFAGVLLFGESPLLVPFNASNMLESAAYITQLLFEGAPLPRMTEKGSPIKQRYVGCWEVWRRMNTHRYRSENDLALAFLAAVDLALSAHVLAQEDGALTTAMERADYSVAIRYIHARLGYIMLASAAFDPLDSSTGSLDAIQKFQDDCSGYLGWPDTGRAYRFMAAFLTRRLIASSLWSFERMVEVDTGSLRTAMLTPLDELTDNLDVLVPMWRMLEASFHSTLEVGAPNYVIGSRLLAKMIASSVFRRIDQPALAAPHLQPQTLTEQFELPCVRVGDQYYTDMAGQSLEGLAGQAIRIPTVDLAVDCIALAVLEPVRSNQSQCGLVDPVTGTANCVYVAGGAGCPQLGLTTAQQERRNAEQVYDWCHWAYASLRTELMPKSFRHEWRKRWHYAPINEPAGAPPVGSIHLEEPLRSQEDAKASFQEAIDSGHADMVPMAAYALALLLESQGDVQDAKAALQKAIDSGHADIAPLAAYNLSVLLESQEDMRAALQEAIDSGHADITALAAYNLALLLACQGDAPGAKAAFQKAIDSGHARIGPLAAYNLGVLLREQGDAPGAKAAFQMAIHSGHDEAVPLASYNLGVLLQEQGDAPGAKAAYQKAIDSGHADHAPKAAVNLGVLLQEQGDAPGAKAAYQKAIDSGHADHAPKAAYNLGLLLASQGNAQGAKAALQKAIDSGHTDIAPLAAAYLGLLVRG